MSHLITRLIEAAESQNQGSGELFEEVVQLACADLIAPGDRVIDIGAHHGLHLFPMARAVGRAGRVFAFEPLPHLLKFLKKQRWRHLLFNINFYPVALGVENKQSTFQFFRNEPGFSGLKRRKTPFSSEEGGLEEIVVPQARLDSVLPADTDISLVKIDIEGGELHALMGGRELLARSRPVILFECGFQNSADIYNYTMEDFFGFFEDLDYSLHSLAGEPFTPDDWHVHPCWELVALPSEKTDLAARFPGYCEQVLKKGSG